MDKKRLVCLFLGIIACGFAFFPPAAQAGVGVSPSSINFGSVTVNSTSSTTFVVMNDGASNLSLDSVRSNLSQVVVSGPALPLMLTPGTGVSFKVTFQATSATTFTGSIIIKAGHRGGQVTNLSVSGTGVNAVTPPPPATYLLSPSANSLAFGHQTVGTTGSLPFTFTNTGTGSVSISQVMATGTGYSVSGFSGAVTLAPGQSLALVVSFAPLAVGSFSGSVTVVSTATNSPASIALSGTGVASTLLLSTIPTSLSFGNQSVGSSASQNVTLTNTGNSSVTVSQVTPSGSGFSLSAISLPLTLSAGQTASFSVAFAPAAAGSVSGTIGVVSNATNSPATISLSGTGVKPMISVTPASVSFGNVTLGVTNTQTVTIQNPGTATLTVSQASLTGAGYSLSGLTTPLSLAPNGSTSFNVGFAPASARSFAGTVTLTNNANSALSIPLSGTGVAATLQLSANPTSLSFGSLSTGSSATQTVTVSNTGNASVTISQITAIGTGFRLSSIGLPVTLSAGQTTSFGVSFAPASAGSVTGSVTITSNATNSPLVVALSGTGATPASHSVSLRWTPSSSTLSGFNVYRASVSGGPYTKVDPALIATSSYSDSSVSSGQTYYYVATEVDSTGTESGYSNEVSAVIP